MLGHWLVATGLGAGLGLAYYFVIEQGLAKEREPALERFRQVLRRQRLAGVDEPSLQQFVTRNSSADWEEYFEDLFGYDALQRARLDLVGDLSGPRRKRFRPLRDRVLAELDRRLDEIRRTRDTAKLRSIEQRALVAGGMSGQEAEAQADQMAAMMVHEAAQWRQAAARYQGATAASQAADPQAAVLAKRARIKAMLAEAKSGTGRKRKTALEQLSGPLDAFLGGHVRLILGTVLLVGCILWMRHNGMFSELSVESVKSAASSAAKSIQEGNPNIGALASQAGVDANQPREPLPYPFGGLVSSFNAGLAGLLLVVSAFFGGWRTSVVAIPLALAIWLLVPGFF
jgi:hypothetical protein